MVFRLYFLDRFNRIAAAENLEAGSLDEAIAQAQRLVAERRLQGEIEIWQGAARVYPPPTPDRR